MVLPLGISIDFSSSCVMMYILFKFSSWSNFSRALISRVLVSCSLRLTHACTAYFSSGIYSRFIIKPKLFICISILIEIRY